MPDIGTWANYAELISGIAVAGGLVFGLYELRRAVRGRDQAAAQATMEVIQRPEILAGVRLLLRLPENADPREIEQDEQMARAASEVGTAFVTFGMNLYSGVATWNVTSQSNPWLVYQVWVRIHQWVRASRYVVGPSNFWPFEWLVAQYQQKGVIPAEPAADPEPYRPGDGMEPRDGP